MFPQSMQGIIVAEFGHIRFAWEAAQQVCCVVLASVGQLRASEARRLLPRLSVLAGCSAAVVMEPPERLQGGVQRHEFWHLLSLGRVPLAVPGGVEASRAIEWHILAHVEMHL